ncbi:SepM family pheromone-processing serine protease [Brevibacillus daliensis]|uniref:SepM family pheromone-processing serine protease n=1 Tax=Brevibacillus daliensis TaxID=2892995 RepID=UPI001E409A58|nr:SepM family pheromone-processing serine protease [Brevibacillus daliensis]
MSNNQLLKANSNKSRYLLLLLITAILALTAISLYVPLPYYVQRAGSAKELAPIITVNGGVKDEAGTFMLTTVRMSKANPAWVLYSYFSKDVDLIPERLLTVEGESPEDYSKRELLVMKNSQQVSQAVALKKAGYKVKMDDRGVLILSIKEGFPAKEILQTGDILTTFDSHPVRNRSDLLLLLEGKKAGETVEVEFLRDNQPRKVSLELMQLPEDNGGKSNRAGLGIVLQDYKQIDMPDKVNISAGNIGGPSAGLMFTLEIYNQLRTDIDLTRGYRIAGTGEMYADGTVGRIGGINHKVIAADAAGAEIFFAPDDTSGDVSNYEEALAAAKRIHTSMRIVPVKTLDDAIQYLMQLTPKSKTVAQNAA